MSTKTISPRGLSAIGAGPKIMRPMLVVLVLGIVLKKIIPSIVAIPFFDVETLKNAGWILTISGSIFWVWALVQFVINFPKGKLITSGVYALSRNPIYASWILFILPGFAGLFNNWIFLLAALVMYISLMLSIKEEEKALADTFGEEYTDYSKRVNRVLFFLE